MPPRIPTRARNTGTGSPQPYGVNRPIEEMMVNRVSDLSWRPHRLQRVERAAIALHTSGTMHNLRHREFTDAHQRAPTSGRSVAHGDDPKLIRTVLHQPRDIRVQLEGGDTPDPRAAVGLFGQVFGLTSDGRIIGRGQMLAGMLFQMADPATGKETRTLARSLRVT